VLSALRANNLTTICELMSRKYGSLNVSLLYEPLLPATGIAFIIWKFLISMIEFDIYVSVKT
jgi:hypothetical protein